MDVFDIPIKDSKYRFSGNFKYPPRLTFTILGMNLPMTKERVTEKKRKEKKEKEKEKSRLNKQLQRNQREFLSHAVIVVLHRQISTINKETSFLIKT